MTEVPGRWVRRLARLLIRGQGGSYVRGDLDESMRRDIDRGIPLARARRRYVVNTVGSAWSLWRDALRVSAGSRVRRVVRLGPTRLGTYWLDVRLALRMLVKHPGLTAVAVFALALGIPASLTPVHLLNIFDTPLAFDEGERIVGLRHRYVAQVEESPGTVHEYRAWSGSLTSFEHIGAARTDRYNVTSAEGRTAPYRGSRMTSSSFAIVRVPPLLGRPLLKSDDAVGAPEVVVIGHALWQSFFEGGTDVVGRTLWIGGAPHEVVGVMPEGFLFPERDHLWLPLRAGDADAQPGAGPELWIFGRLTDGVTEARALAEMTSVHRGLAEAYPEVYGELRPEIVRFTYLTTGNPREMKWYVAPFQLLALALLAVACGNVGTLILARTAARGGEIAVRTALGASRARIVTQLFVESLALAVVATGVGLAIAAFGLELFDRQWDHSGTPFWLRWGLSARTVAQAFALSIFCAVIAGVVPALRATGRGIHGRMQRAGVGRSGVRFGHATTALIVVEVALGVVCAFAGVVGYRMLRWNEAAPMAVPVERFLAAHVSLADRSRAGAAPADEAEFRARVARVQRELVRRLASEPGVGGVAIARSLPGESHWTARVDVEGARGGGADGAGHRVLRGWADVGFFDALGQSIVHGRGFTETDLPPSADATSRVAIVNTAFVDRVLRGGNAIGRRVRLVAEPGEEPNPWLEIVGVVGMLGMIDFDGMRDGAGLYHPAAPGALHPIRMAVELAGEPSAFTPRLRQIAAAIDPDAMVASAMPLGELEWHARSLMRWGILALAIVASISIVLSLAGFYALLAFTIAQRRHEIGVRTALGATAAGIIAVIARRAAAQLALGVLVGVTATAVLVRFAVPYTADSPLAGWPPLLAATACAVVLLGALACAVPMRRGLRIQPTEALRV